MISDARGSHVSPGIYTEERDVTYSVKSLGITSLGLVGETLYGPAFQNVEIENWGEFVDYFGGTSTEKFKGTGYPKYELPYIAKSYLEDSKRLNVVRVLGLSGYNAGPAWPLKDKNGNVICVLRSKMTYDESSGNPCTTSSNEVSQMISTIQFGNYEETMFSSVCTDEDESGTTINGDIPKFKITATYSGSTTDKVVYNVTLNPNDSNYIYKVLSNRPDTGNTPIYIDAVYENSIVSEIDFDKSNVKPSGLTDSIYTNFKSQFRYAQTPWILSDAIVEKGTSQNTEASGSTEAGGGNSDNTEAGGGNSDNTEAGGGNSDNTEVEGRNSDNAEAGGSNSGNTKPSYTATMKKLFKFITISDGNAANYQVKVSIQNIKPKEGTFDVYVRDFNDTDANPIVLERFSRCNLVEGDANYIAFRIGSSDGGYASKSKYIAVKMGENGDLKNSIPAGFLGYPMPTYGSNSTMTLAYNNVFKPEIRAKKQYFGVTNLFDTDVLSFKGKNWYDDEDATPSKLTNGFHMDSAIENCGDSVFVDGVSGFNFTVVSQDKVTSKELAPRLIANEVALNGSIYNDINVRKFTVCFYGGFDGWDVNRDERTNTDNFKATQYNPGTGTIFQDYSGYTGDVEDAVVDLPQTAITSDYYAYLAGCRVFANPQDIDINIFATPGINWYNHNLLTEEIIELIEDADGGRGGDALYVMSSPNSVDATFVADEFEHLELNSSYACTYFPWIMYYDASNKKYLELPVTKDVVKNMAHTDNNSFPWFAPAGMQRGGVNCIKACFKTTLADEDALYEVGINPVKSYAQDGVKIWGNKTTYTADSPLNRINVRRLMIRVKKLITEAANSLIFEQYDETLEKQFRGIVEPILANVKANRGIIDYRVITESTPETRDQHILPAKILIKPTQALEYISISFVVYPESVSFDEN